MAFVGILLTFGGYVLVYAATARGGRFATEPWAGLYADAYLTGPEGPNIPAPVTPVTAAAQAAGNALPPRPF